MQGSQHKGPRPACRSTSTWATTSAFWTSRSPRTTISPLEKFTRQASLLEKALGMCYGLRRQFEQPSAECCCWLVLPMTMASLGGCKTCSLYFAVQFVIERERRGDYLGKTVQVVPHITDAIQVGLAA